jgi:hypothetical protein
VVRRVRLRCERDRSLSVATSQVLLAACELSDCWIEYDRARKGLGGRYLVIASRLEALAAQSKSALNLWVQGERFNLLSLVYRRAAVDLPASAASAGNRHDWAERSLALNHDAIELASLGGNQQSLATYMSNRSLLLADLAGAGLTWCKGQSPETWEDAVRWLMVSEDFARGLNGGGDSLWSGPYWLTIVRLARPVCKPSALLKVAQRDSAWFRATGATDVVEAAMALAEPALGQMLAQITHHKADVAKRFDRQITVMCRELGDLADRDSLHLSNYPAIKPLHRWARRQTGVGSAHELKLFLARCLPESRVISRP